MNNNNYDVLLRHSMSVTQWLLWFLFDIEKDWEKQRQVG